jgi:metallo-beta-lactamase class B
MNIRRLAPLLALCIASILGAAAAAEDPRSEVQRRVETARAAAGTEFAFIFGGLCEGPIRAVGAAPVTAKVPAALPSTDPARDWYTGPVRVFDDLLFLGQTGYSVWGLRTPEGIILLDSIFDYSVEAEVLDGLRKLNVNPAEIKYVIISHAHADHVGGAGILQRAGARVVMSEVDWRLYEDSKQTDKAKRDIVATDGMAIKLGNSTVRMYLTPGHTHGTLSTLLTVHDHGKPHVAALWGGTLFNFKDSAEDPRSKRLQTYADSAKRFREIVRAAKVDILLSNHTAFDGSTLKLPMLASPAAGAPNPYIIGNAAVLRFLDAAEQCAIATRIAESPSFK